ncbi:MAG: DNA adenine methylase [Candidatus Brocadiia bacterium]
MTVPHPIPYQGSKRKLAPVILRYFPDDVEWLYEPFAGSAAVSLAAAQKGKAERFWISDCLEPLMGIWQMILECPEDLAAQYSALWHAQSEDPGAFYLRVRDEFNQTADPARLLYLVARCVKNAIRFNPDGEFNQSPDHRRKGRRPTTMRNAILGASRLLAGRCKAQSADYREALRRPRTQDLVYMDPPYQGVNGRDPRYHRQVAFDELMEALENLNGRGIRYLLSYDGSCGGKSYGEEPPEQLQLTRVSVHVGKSAQATLVGRSADTVESLYVSPRLADELGARSRKVSVRNLQGQSALFQ